MILKLFQLFYIVCSQFDIFSFVKHFVNVFNNIIVIDMAPFKIITNILIKIIT